MRSRWLYLSYWVGMRHLADVHEEMREAQRRSTALREQAEYHAEVARQRQDARDHMRAILVFARMPWARTNPAALGAVALHLRDHLRTRLGYYFRAVRRLEDGIRAERRLVGFCRMRSEAYARDVHRLQQSALVHRRRL